ncbi:MAG: efflux RND transporter permease subunit [Candidatus Schekmanbacteria bacterium]|nr:efflux RND transporter permease subunit [Candidatus Schekmanbacteria bacterium]
MVCLAAVVFGYFSYDRLPLALMPELSYPTLTVRTEYPGSAPEEVENDISRPIEEALGVIGGLRRLSSISRAGVSDVVLEFSWDMDMSEVIQSTVEKLDLVTLPEEAERPLILRFDPSLDPIMVLSLASESTGSDEASELRRLRRLAELLVKRALEPIKGVAAVQIRGGLEEEVQVNLDQRLLRRSGISVQVVADRLRQDNVNVAGGTIREGRAEYMVRTLNEYRTVDEIRAAVVLTREGREVRVADLGEVVWAHKDPEMITRADGKPCVLLEIYKEADANIVAVAERVKEVVGDSAASLGAGGDPAPPHATTMRRPWRAESLAETLAGDAQAALRTVADRSLFIVASIREVRDTALFGGLLAIGVLFLFLRDIRSTAIIAVSIPISLVVTFAPLNALGVSLNVMSLGGLALGVGMLVDSSIVVLESIYKCREEGDELVAAALRGTREVTMAVTASTLTTIAVFLPMVFLEGVAGQAFADLGLAVVISLLASLIVALFFIPMLASRRGSRPAPIAVAMAGTSLRWRVSLASISSFRADWRWALGPRKDAAASPRAVRVGAGFAFGIGYLVPRLVAAVSLELAARALSMMLLGATWLLAQVVIPVLSLAAWKLVQGPTALTQWGLGQLHRSYRPVLSCAIYRPGLVALAVAASVGVTGLILARLESELLPDVHQGEVTLELSLPVGTPLAETNRLLAAVEREIRQRVSGVRSLLVTIGHDPANTRRSDEGENTAQLRLLLADSRPETEAAAVAAIRAAIARVPDLEARLTRPVLFSFKAPIEIEVHGEDLGKLKVQGDRTRQAVTALPEVADVETTMVTGAPEVRVELDRDRLARYGLALGPVADLIKAAVNGTEATRFNLADRQVPIVVRLKEQDRRTVEDVAELVVNPGGERPVTLAAVAAVGLAEGPSEIRRIDGQRVNLTTANIARGSLSSTVAAIERVLRTGVSWPDGMDFTISGQSQEWQRSQRSLLLALGLSVFLVYVIMAAQFESFLQPLIIMLTIPLAFAGTVTALWVLGISVSIVVLLGMILLAGIVVNNAIVLVDYANTLGQRGLDAAEAVIAAGKARLRPILMTTATTALGLMPMAMGFGEGAEIRSPLAIAVLTGLTSSTVLTLVIIPTVYARLVRRRP